MDKLVKFFNGLALYCSKNSESEFKNLAKHDRISFVEYLKNTVHLEYAPNGSLFYPVNDYWDLVISGGTQNLYLVSEKSKVTDVMAMKHVVESIAGVVSGSVYSPILNRLGSQFVIDESMKNIVRFVSTEVTYRLFKPSAVTYLNQDISLVDCIIFDSDTILLKE